MYEPPFRGDVDWTRYCDAFRNVVNHHGDREREAYFGAFETCEIDCDALW